MPQRISYYLFPQTAHKEYQDFKKWIETNKVGQNDNILDVFEDINTRYPFKNMLFGGAAVFYCIILPVRMKPVLKMPCCKIVLFWR
ncbi:hypothetical protein MNBD_ALPHA02-2180 [hydrothermal vent metagenome]|uniref:Uncharacterized protein n=1 Tax=hydrothermal vent metagenome TaxID=652676 RepID=A0A3B0RHQ8_9ZZZZ